MMAKEIPYSLHQAHKENKVREGSTLNVSDIVLLHDELHRNRWKLCIIKKVFPGTDGPVQAANLRMASGKIMKRAIEKLQPLEIRTRELEQQTTETFKSNPEEPLHRRLKFKFGKL